jgi:hypothetical protein
VHLPPGRCCSDGYQEPQTEEPVPVHPAGMARGHSACRVERICARFIEFYSRASTFEALPRGFPRTLPDIPATSWLAMRRAVPGNPVPGPTHTAAGRGVPLRLGNRPHSGSAAATRPRAWKASANCGASPRIPTTPLRSVRARRSWWGDRCGAGTCWAGRRPPAGIRGADPQPAWNISPPKHSRVRARTETWQSPGPHIDVCSAGDGVLAFVLTCDELATLRLRAESRFAVGGHKPRSHGPATVAAPCDPIAARGRPCPARSRSRSGNGRRLHRPRHARLDLQPQELARSDRPRQRTDRHLLQPLRKTTAPPCTASPVSRGQTSPAADTIRAHPLGAALVPWRLASPSVARRQAAREGHSSSFANARSSISAVAGFTISLRRM